jgi:hypothetical protein
MTSRESGGSIPARLLAVKSSCLIRSIALGALVLGVFVSCGTNSAESAYSQDRVVGDLNIPNLTASTDSLIQAGAYPAKRSGWWLHWSLPLSTDGMAKIYIFDDTLSSAQRAKLVNGSSAPDLGSLLVATVSDTDTAWEIPVSLLEGKQGRYVSTQLHRWFSVWVQYGSGNVGVPKQVELFLGDDRPPEVPVLSDSIGQTQVVLRFSRPMDQSNAFDTLLKGPLKTVRALWWAGLSASDSAGNVASRSVPSSELADPSLDSFRLVLSPLKYWTRYCYQLEVVDTAGNVSRSEIYQVTTRDSIPPAAPAVLSDTIVRSDSVVFSWKAATDTFASDGAALSGFSNHHIYQYTIRVNGARMDSVQLDDADSKALGDNGTWPASTGVSCFQWNGSKWTWYWRNFRPGRAFKVDLIVTDMSGNDAKTIPSASGAVPAGVSSGTCPSGWVAVSGGTSGLSDYCIEEHEHLSGGKIQTRATWSEAIQACSDAGAQLCSEAQWVRACSTFPDDNQTTTYGAIEAGVDGDTLSWLESYCQLQTGDSTKARDSSTSDPRCVSGWGVFDMPGRVGEWTRDVYLTDTTNAVREPGSGAYVGVSDLTNLADIGTIHGGSSLILGSPNLALASARCTERNYPATSATDTLANGTTRAHPSPNGKSSGWGFRCCQIIK